MKTKNILALIVALCVLASLAAAQPTDVKRYFREYGLSQAGTTAAPKPKLDNGVKIGTADYTVAELNAALGGGTVSGLVTGITAGTTQTQAGGTLLTGVYNNVTVVGTAGDGVRLPTAAAGLVVTVRNSDSTDTLKVWPFLADSINALSVNLSVDLPAGLEITFTAINDTVWSGVLSGFPTVGTVAPSQFVTLDANSLFDGSKLHGLDYSIAAAGTAFAPSSATEAVMNLGTYTIAANRLQALGYIDFSAVALIGAVNATDTFTFNVELTSVSASDTAGTVVATKVQGATTAANDYAKVSGRINIRSIVTTTCTMTSDYQAGGLLAGVLASQNGAFVGAFTKDSTAALFLNVTGKWSTASATNSATLQKFDVKVVGN